MKFTRFIILVISVLLPIFIAAKADTTVSASCSRIDTSKWPYVAILKTCWFGASMKIQDNDTSLKYLDEEGTHDTGSIEAVMFTSASEIHFLPKNLKTIFPKLKVLSLFIQPIKNLESADLKVFGNDLQFFRADKCQISSLDANLFEHNKHLKYIDFGGNPLKNIDPEFFNNLSKMVALQEVDLRNSRCIDQRKIKSDLKKPKWDHKLCN